MNTLKGKRILLVDDHVMFTDGLKSLLKLHDRINEIVNVENAENALEYLEQEKFDLITMDINLLEISGI